MTEHQNGGRDEHCTRTEREGAGSGPQGERRILANGQLGTGHPRLSSALREAAVAPFLYGTRDKDTGLPVLDDDCVSMDGDYLKDRWEEFDNYEVVPLFLAASPAAGAPVAVKPPEAWELEAAAIFMDHVDDDETGSVHRVAAFLRAVAASPAGVTASPASHGVVPVCRVMTMEHSSGAPDHYVSVEVGDRQITPHMYKIRARAEYDVAEWNWLFNGGEKPFILDFDTEAAALAPALAEGVEMDHNFT